MPGKHVRKYNSSFDDSLNPPLADSIHQSGSTYIWDFLSDSWLTMRHTSQAMILCEITLDPSKLPILRRVRTSVVSFLTAELGEVIAWTDKVSSAEKTMRIRFSVISSLIDWAYRCRKPDSCSMRIRSRWSESHCFCQGVCFSVRDRCDRTQLRSLRSWISWREKRSSMRKVVTFVTQTALLRCRINDHSSLEKKTDIQPFSSTILPAVCRPVPRIRPPIFSQQTWEFPEVPGWDSGPTYFRFLPGSENQQSCNCECTTWGAWNNNYGKLEIENWPHSRDWVAR